MKSSKGNIFYVELPKSMKCINDSTKDIADMPKRNISKPSQVKIESKVSNDLSYYTSREFNLFEVVHHLKSNSDWIAKDRSNREYIYTDKGLRRVCDDEWLPNKIIDITDELLNMKFTLIPPQSEEEWVDITSEEVIMMILEKEIGKLRVIDSDNNPIEVEQDKIRMLSISGVEALDWQKLKGCKKSEF